MWDSWVVEGICKKRELPKRDFKNLNTGCISIGNTYQYSSTWDSWVFGVLPKKEIFVTSITKYISIRNIYQYSPMWDSYVLRGSWMHAYSSDLTVYNIYIVFRTTVLERIHDRLNSFVTVAFEVISSVRLISSVPICLQSTIGIQSRFP